MYLGFNQKQQMLRFTVACCSRSHSSSSAIEMTATERFTLSQYLCTRQNNERGGFKNNIKGSQQCEWL